MALRDALLSPLDFVRGVGARLGLRVYTVKLRTRTWSGARPGLGANTDVDTPMLVTRLTVSDGAMTSGGATLTCATSAPFKSSDIGKVIQVVGAAAGGANLITTIAAMTSTSVVTLASPAGVTIAAASVSYGFPCRVEQISRGEIIASGGLYTDQDLKVGPLTPAYINPATGGYADAAIEPPVVSATEVFWLISGPQVPAAGGVYTQVGEEATALHYYVFVRKAPAAQ